MPVREGFPKGRFRHNVGPPTVAVFEQPAAREDGGSASPSFPGRSHREGGGNRRGVPPVITLRRITRPVVANKRKEAFEEHRIDRGIRVAFPPGERVRMPLTGKEGLS